MAVEQTALARLDADITDFIAKMDQANAVWDQRLGSLEARATRLGGAIKDSFGDAAAQTSDSFGGAFGLIEAYALKVGGIVAGAFGAGKIVDAVTNFQKAELQLRLLGSSGTVVERDLAQLTSAALRSGQSIQTLAEQTRALAQTRTFAGRSTSDVIKLEEDLVDAFKRSGKSASENGGAFDALKTIARENKVEIGNFNTLLDKTPTILTAVAAGLIEANGDLERLRKLIDDGKLSGTDFFRAFEAGRPVLQNFPDAVGGIAQAMQSLETAIGGVVGKLDRAINGSQVLIAVLNNVAAVANSIKDVGSGAERIEYDALGNPIRSHYGPGTVTNPLGTTGPAATTLPRQGRASVQDISGLPPDQGQPLVRPTVSVKNNPPPPDDKKGGSADTLNAYEKEIEASKKRIETLQVETAVINSSRLEQFRALEAQKLLTAAKEAGIPVTDELKKKIDEQAMAEARAKVAAEEAARARQKIIQASDSFRSDLTSGITSFSTELRSAFMDGKISAEEFSQAAMNAVGRLADYLIEIAARNLVASIFGATGTPVPGAGSFFASLFGRAGGGPVNAGQAYRVGESGPELFVPRGAGTIIPAGSAGGTTIVYAPVSDYRGADAAVVARVELMQRAQSRQIAAIVGAPDGQRRGTSR